MPKLAYKILISPIDGLQGRLSVRWIVHNGLGHWLMITNIGATGSAEVMIYDNICIDQYICTETDRCHDEDDRD